MLPNNSNNNSHNLTNNNSSNMAAQTAEKPKKKSRRRQVPKDSPEYQLRRDRNNVSVRKCRINNKVKAKQTTARVNELRNENQQLEQQVKLLAKELGVLKDLFKMSNPMAAVASVPGLEAAIQTDDIGDDYSAQGVLDSINTQDFDFISDHDQGKPSEVEVNTRALQKDHEYVIKYEDMDV